ncbi:MAG: hypothetical protein CM1200mP27_10070 [Chloroflexota bacterium]|nr:MAG: hypothetical protein CM1200mP27_10070 [Chloroflexota bacterium]
MGSPAPQIRETQLPKKFEVALGDNVNLVILIPFDLVVQTPLAFWHST